MDLLVKTYQKLKIKKVEIEKGMSVLNLLASQNIVSSKSEARRIIQNKGLKINDKTLEDSTKIIYLNDFNDLDYLKISIGKKHYLIKYK